MRVSAVMPTRGRQRLAVLAVDVYLSQTYGDKELIVLDDADNPSFPDGLDSPGVCYHRTELPMNIPQKRNAVNRLSSGELIWHLDSDDWSAPERMADQVQRMEESGKAITGYCSMLFHDDAGGIVARYQSAPNFYALGSSLCYRRAYWESHPFDEKRAIASDNHFLYPARDAGQLISVDGGLLMVARAHEDNTSRKQLYKPDFRKQKLSDLPEGYLRTCQQALDVTT